MRRSRRPITIASRRSHLARAQAELVGRALARLHPTLDVKYVWIESEGDAMSTRSLADAGGKGLFARAIERAVLAAEADLAVHSLKDLPTQETPGLRIAAVPPRADVRDCLISRCQAHAINQLPPQAVLGTSSPRRAAQLRRLRSDLRIVPLRGNIETRLAKVMHGAAATSHGQSLAVAFGNPAQPPSCDATLLAMAGLLRANLQDQATAPLDVDDMLPAAGQGALAIQCRADDHVTLTRLLPLNHPATASAVHAERTIVHGLQGDCHSPIAVYAQPLDALHLRLRARVLSLDGQTCLETDGQTTLKGLAKLARQMIKDLRARGSDSVLHSPPAQPVTP